MMMKNAKPSPEMLKQAADRLRSLADEVRLRLLLRLRRGEANVSTLVSDLGIAQASVSKHLALLRQQGIVKVRRSGAMAFYSLRDESAMEIVRITFECVRRHHSETSQAIGMRVPSFEI